MSKESRPWSPGLPNHESLLLRLILMALLVTTVNSTNPAAAKYMATQNRSGCPVTLLDVPDGHIGVRPVLEKHESALLMLLGFGGFSIVLAILHNSVRKYIYHDEHNLDTTFDAGGNVSLSLTAVTVASQLFWPGDILHSATLATKNGVAGPFWYAVGIMFNIFIFPMLSVHFKTRAPGAKTYLQVMHARYGRATHAVFCCFALLTNLVITIGVIMAGQATIKSLTKDASDEFTVIIMATLFGSYSLIGGLGTTFYVSYFNACLVFVLLIVFVAKIFHMGDERYSTIGNMDTMYNAIMCVKGPDDNEQNSFLTFRSSVALLYGVIEIFVSSAVTFCDQASWQSRIAAKPTQGVWGFILASLMWFAIPSTMATTTGMAYLALSSQNGTHMLNTGQIDEGLVTPLIAEKILGGTGGIMILTMGAMALMSTGSGEVMAVSSIIVYDIYQSYVKPFRRNLKRNQCVLCGKIKRKIRTNGDVASDQNGVVAEQNGSGGGGDGGGGGGDDTGTDGGRGGGGSCGNIRGSTGPVDHIACSCPLVSNCSRCTDDLEARQVHDKHSPTRFHYKCPIHGQFREYQDDLIQFKNWCIVLVTLGIIPLGLTVFKSGIDLNWIFYVGSIVTIPCFPPVLLSILWVKATGKGLMIGSILGLLGGIIVTLGVASTYPGGLNNFLLNTVQDNVLLAGTTTSFAVSLAVCIGASLLTHEISSPEKAEQEWQKMFDIDNPLKPWEENYREDLAGMDYDQRPSSSQMDAAFRTAKLTAFIGGGVCIFIFAFVIPGIMASFSVMNKTQFKVWVGFTQLWALFMAFVVIFLPPFEEFSRIRRQYQMNKRLSQKEEMVEVKDNYYPMSEQPVIAKV